MNLGDLSAPFSSSAIHWRPGSTNLNKDGSLKWGDKPVGKPLAYLDARDVMERLDKVCGPENWQCDYPWSDGKKVVCRIGIRVNGEWVWKSNGAGDTQVEQEKGAMSDAFKRAAVLWGIGQYLYGCKMGYFDLNKYKQFDEATIKKIQKEYESWLICDEGPIPSLIERQAVLGKYLESVAAIKRGIAEGDLSTASEEWFSLDGDVKRSLWIAKSKGGIFEPSEMEVIKSREFREANGEAA